MCSRSVPQSSLFWEDGVLAYAFTCLRRTAYTAESRAHRRRSWRPVPGPGRPQSNDYSPADLDITLSPDLDVRSDPSLGEFFVSNGAIRFRAGSEAGTAEAIYTVRDSQGNPASTTVISAAGIRRSGSWSRIGIMSVNRAMGSCRLLCDARWWCPGSMGGCGRARVVGQSRMCSSSQARIAGWSTASKSLISTSSTSPNAKEP